MARKKSKAPSKLQHVREALASGIEKPLEILEHLKKLGVTMTAAAISNYKSVLKAQGARPSPAKPKRRGRRRMAQASSGAPTASNGTRSSSGSYVDQLVRLKELVRELGADEVKKLTDILA